LLKANPSPQKAYVEVVAQVETKTGKFLRPTPRRIGLGRSQIAIEELGLQPEEVSGKTPNAILAEG
jgi:hypothetical protein